MREVRKYGYLFYCHQITSPSEMPLYSLIIIIFILFMWKNRVIVNKEASYYVRLFGGTKIGNLIF
jgi:hypothetical protein